MYVCAVCAFSHNFSFLLKVSMLDAIDLNLAFEKKERHNTLEIFYGGPIRKRKEFERNINSVVFQRM